MQTTHIKMRLKKTFPLVIVVLFTLLFSGCFDLGKFEDIQTYYASFGEVRLINQTRVDNYSFKDYFYNENSVNSFSGNIVGSDEYVYLVLPAQSDFVLSEFSLFLKSEKSSEIHFSLYISDFIPGKIRGYFDPEKEVEKDSDGNVVYDGNGNPKMKAIDYDDLSQSGAMYQGSIRLIANAWDSFTAKLTNKQSANKDAYQVTSGQNIVVKFENNSGFGKDEGYDNVSFCMTNLLIRAI